MAEDFLLFYKNPIEKPFLSGNLEFLAEKQVTLIDLIFETLTLKISGLLETNRAINHI